MYQMMNNVMMLITYHKMVVIYANFNAMIIVKFVTMVNAYNVI